MEAFLTVIQRFWVSNPPLRNLFLLSNCAWLLACAGTQQQPTTPKQAEVVNMEAMRITAHAGPDGAFTLEAYDAEELYDFATNHFQQKRCDSAVTAYDRLVAEFPESHFVGPALFNAGLCLQATSDFAGAAEHYRRLLELRPTSDDVLFASLRLAEVLVQLQEYDAALATADQVLSRTELSHYDRLEAMARRSQALLGQGKLDDAEAYAKSALSYFRTHSKEEEFADEFFAAANNFVVAEAYRMRAEAVVFPEDLEGQKNALLKRAEFVVEAQRQYSNTISFVHVDNYHWMTASGYRIGQTYDDLWHAVMNAPVPAHLPPDATQVYREELAKLIKPLIRHAIRYWEMTLMLVERTGIKNAWTDKTRQDLDRVRALMLQQPPGPGGIPPAAAATTPSQTPDQASDPSPATQAPSDALQPPPANSQDSATETATPVSSEATPSAPTSAGTTAAPAAPVPGT